MFRLNHGSKQLNATYYSNSGDSESFEAAPQCIFRLIFVFCMPRFILHLRLLQKTLRWVSVQATTPAGSENLRSASNGLSKKCSPQALAPIHYQLLSNLGIARTTKRSHFGSSLLLADSFVKRFSIFTRSSVGAVDPRTNHRILRNVRNLEQQKAIENNAKS